MREETSHRTSEPSSRIKGESLNGALLLIASIIILILGYILYGRWLARKWGIDPSRETPAHTEYDGVDFVPAKPSVLLGHHFSSIAGAGPITGPIQAAVFGWLPVTLWVLIGGLFFGAVHDFGSMFASVRNKGRSIGEIISESMGSRAKKLFIVFAYLTLILVIAAFASIVADTFDGFTSDAEQNLTNGVAASISMLFIFAAVVLGAIMNRFNLSSVASAAVAIVILLICVAIGMSYPIYIPADLWIWILALYIMAAAIVPVWILLQPRDYLCSFLLYGVTGAAIAGIILANPELSLPGFTSFETELGYLFPALFITVACGAISGFHSLVASGTTAKQIDNERNILPIGYGGMLIECVIAIIALVCVGILYSDGSMPSGTPTQIFAQGISSMLSSVGLESYETTTYSLVILAVSAFALTSLDTATRLARFMLQEFFLEKDQKPKDLQGAKRIIAHPAVATVITVMLGMALATVGYEKVWGLFGAANQLLAVLALLAVCAWLGNIGRNNRMIYIPMMFMLAATLSSLVLTMWSKIGDLAAGLDGVAAAQLVISALLFVLAVFLMAEGLKVLIEQRRARMSEGTSRG